MQYEVQAYISFRLTHTLQVLSCYLSCYFAFMIVHCMLLVKWKLLLSDHCKGHTGQSRVLWIASCSPWRWGKQRLASTAVLSVSHSHSHTRSHAVNLRSGWRVLCVGLFFVLFLTITRRYFVCISYCRNINLDVKVYFLTKHITYVVWERILKC